MEDFVLPNETQVVLLDCKRAFDALSDPEKYYAHYLSRAAWYGGLIVLLQTSQESPLIFNLLHTILKEEPVAQIRAKVPGLSDEDFKGFLVYACGVFSNMGNYKSFGDSKFIPSIPKNIMEEIVFSSEAYTKDPSRVHFLWNNSKAEMYSLKPSQKALGFPPKGTTTYFSLNCDASDSALVNDFMKENNMEGYNCRTFKTKENGKVTYEIRLASLESGFDPRFMLPEKEFKGCTFRVTRSDYKFLLQFVIENLDKALPFTANNNEKMMLWHYINSFQTGKLSEHKEGSRFWIKDKSPIIETYIGFIETYRDPGGIRGEFEGFVAMVNKEMSAKFTALVNAAQTFICRLPWPATFEKDEFLQPDFTSLDVLSFSGSGIPAGINIPNYDEIRQEEGFKNVSLGNVIPATYKTNEFFFLSPEDQELMSKYSIPSFEVQVGLHELLGHGSGKLFKKMKDGCFNFVSERTKDPITGNAISSWYEEGETYDSVFTDISSSYEECRAECVGLYLSLDREILKIFGHEGEEADAIMYTNWLNLLWAGAGKALEMYHPESKLWLQAHSQARFVITRVILEAGEGLFTINEVDGGNSLLFTLDKSKLETVGKKKLGEFLLKLQVYKSTRNVEAARAMYEKYSAVDDDGACPWSRWRNIVMKNKRPRKMFVQCNTYLSEEGDVKLKEYEATHEGLIQSWVDRFSQQELEHLDELWKKDIDHFVD